MQPLTIIRNGVTTLWRADPFLTAVGVLLLAALVPMLVGLVADPRTITGAPAWLKPAKFAASTAIYSFTLAWILGHLRDWRSVRWTASRVTGLVFLLEVAIIAAQAWRGTTSHFNVGTPLDATLFRVMGAAIVTQTLIGATVAVAVWRQAFADRALGWALRMGLLIAFVGASSGGLMVRTSDAQRAAARAGQMLTIKGAHTVGAPDGGPGIPGTGWSLTHGDLRVAHFVGLHAMQALPLLALLLRRRLPDGRRVRTVLVSAVAWLALFAILVWQALRGQSIVAPDATTLFMVAAWLAGTAVAVWAASRHSGRPAARCADWARA